MLKAFACDRWPCSAPSIYVGQITHRIGTFPTCSLDEKRDALSRRLDNQSHLQWKSCCKWISLMSRPRLGRRKLICIIDISFKAQPTFGEEKNLWFPWRLLLGKPVFYHVPIFYFTGFMHNFNLLYPQKARNSIYAIGVTQLTVQKILLIFFWVTDIFKKEYIQK